MAASGAAIFLCEVSVRLKLRLSFLLSVAYVAVLGVLTSLPAEADGQVRASVVATPGAPVTLTHCAASLDTLADLSASGSIVNRSDVFLTSYVIRWYQYDHAGNLMTSQDSPYGFGTDLAPNDTASALPIDLSGSNEPRSALSEVKCRLESARFEGGLTWTYGRVWHRRLAPMPRAGLLLDNEPSNSELTKSLKSGPVSSISGVTIMVTNAWNDMVNGNLFVHVALEIQTNADALIGPANLQLTMKLADEKDHIFSAMTDSAPTYQKLSPLGQTSTTLTAYEVDPKEDLGHLGSAKLSAGSTSHIVATFAIGNLSVPDPKDNKRVILK